MKAAIMGYGTIGSGVYEVLDKNCKSVEKKAGEPIEVKYILDLREFPGSPVEKLVIHDVEQIVNDPEIGIVVETMGGIKPAYEFVKRCLLAGKHVVTSNKALVAAHGTELIRIDAEPKGNLQGTQHRLHNGNGRVIEGQRGVIAIHSIQLNAREGTIDENCPITIPGHNRIPLYRRRRFGRDVESIRRIISTNKALLPKCATGGTWTT